MLCLAQECQNPNLLGRWNQESLTHRVARAGVSQNWREALGGTGMSPAAVGRNPDGPDSLNRRTPVIAQNSCHWPQAAPEVRPAKLPSSWSPIYSQSGFPSVEQKVTLSWENGHRNLSFSETNLKRILPNSGIKECNFLIQKHLLHRPLSVGWLVGRMAWLVGRLVCQPYFHIFTLWVYLNPHRVLYILVVFPLLYKQALLEEVSLGY